MNIYFHFIYRFKSKAFIILLIIIQILSFAAKSNNVFAEGISVSASSAILIEASSNRVLFSKNSEKQLPMASTTKIITAVTAIESFDFDKNRITEISAAAANTEGSSVYLKQGEKISLEDLLYGLMLSSGNDAAVAIAEEIGGDVQNFINMMNETANKIGLNNTHLTNPNGLPDENHYSTAVDMAKVTAYALKNPLFKEIVGCKSRITKKPESQTDNRITTHSLKNHNKLLWMYDGCIGVKTGFTKAAGRCLVSAAEKDGMTLIAVTLNAPDDWNDHINMLNYGYENFSLKTVVNKSQQICTAKAMGAEDTPISVKSVDDIFYPIKKDETINSEISIYPHLSAPINKNEKIGTVTVNVYSNSTKSQTQKTFTVDLISDNYIPLEENLLNIQNTQTLKGKKEESFSTVFKRFILFWITQFST